MAKTLLIVASALLVAGCPRAKREPAPASSDTSARASVPGPAAPAPASASPTAAPIAARGYSLGAECSKPDAIAREGRTLAPNERWDVVASKRERLSLRVPPGVFRVREDASGLSLVSSVKAQGLGPDGKGERPFSIQLRRSSREIDELLADRSESSPLARVYVEGAFPGRTAKSFTVVTDERMGPGTSERITVGGRPAYRFVNGAEGYDSDGVLVDLGSRGTLLVVASWNSSVMAGQPECWQRAIVAGVVQSLRADDEPRR